MTPEQEYLYENSNVFYNPEMDLDIQNEDTYHEDDEQKTYKKPFSNTIKYHRKIERDEDGMIFNLRLSKRKKGLINK